MKVRNNENPQEKDLKYFSDLFKRKPTTHPDYKELTLADCLPVRKRKWLEKRGYTITETGLAYKEPLTV